MLLTVSQFREHVPDVALEDGPLRIMLDSNERAIERRVGPLHGARETVYSSGLSLLHLRTTPLSITSVVDITGETSSELEPADYRIRGDALERVYGGWGSRTEVEYVPANDAADRIVCLVQLMKVDLNFEPGVLSQSGGGSFEAYTGDPAELREAILDRLAQRKLFA